MNEIAAIGAGDEMFFAAVAADKNVVSFGFGATVRSSRFRFSRFSPQSDTFCLSPSNVLSLFLRDEAENFDKQIVYEFHNAFLMFVADNKHSLRKIQNVNDDAVFLEEA